MLSSIRKNATGLGMSLLIGLLVITFSFWGVQNYLTGASNDAVATVNGEKITVNDYHYKFNLYRQRLINQLGQNFDPSQLDTPLARRQFLEELINAEVLRQAASGAGFTVTPEQLRATISQAPVFQIDGQFSKEAYANFLRNRGQSAQAFEQTLTDEMTSSAVADLVSVSAFATDIEARQAWRLTNQKRDFDFVLLSPETFVTDYQPTNEEIEEFYREFGDLFMQPERVNVEYIELSLDDLARQIEIDEDAVRNAYEEGKANPASVGKRRAAHILITADGDDAAAQTKARELYDQIISGADFSELAKAESQDPASAAQGGDLGMVELGVMVPEFDQALFSMGWDEISKPVKTQFGYHIIKTFPYPAYDEVKEKLAQNLRMDEADEAFLSKANELETQVLESYDNLDEAAQKAGLEVKQTGLFDRENATGIAAHPNFQQATFSTEVIEDGRNSDVIDLGDNHIAFVKLIEHKPAARKPLAEVKHEIIDSLKAQKGQELALAAGEEIAKAVTGVESLALIAAERQLPLQSHQQIKRTDPGVSRPLLQVAFSMPAPKEGQVAVKAAPVGGGQVAVVALKGVHDVNASEAPATELEAIKAQIRRNAAENELQAVLEQLKADADIVVFEDRLSLE